jgi:starch phosphorylase
MKTYAGAGRTGRGYRRPVPDLEPDAALGNGGLGRLAACFLDSMATLGLAGFGYGIRYDYGMFKQQIVDGNQVETPDYWLAGGNPWEFPRPDVQYRVRFGGRVEQDRRAHGLERYPGRDGDGLRHHRPRLCNRATNTLRLWSAKAGEEFNLSALQPGRLRGGGGRRKERCRKRVARAVSGRLDAGRPRTAGAPGVFLLRRQPAGHVGRFLAKHDDFDRLPEHVAIHLNDTHPVLAIPELMRILIDEHDLAFPRAWAITQQVFSYTNHTLMQEALETWPVDMLGPDAAAPPADHLRHQHRLHRQHHTRIRPGFRPDAPRIADRRNGERRVRMAYLAVVASHKVNGVSALHSDLMKQSIFADFARRYPDRFTNKTNGITPRRWLSQANPALSELIDARIGPRLARDLDKLVGTGDRWRRPRVREQFRAAKLQNKQRLADWVGAASRHHGRSHLAVRRAGQAHPRIQAPAAQRAARDHALQPHPRQSGRRLGAAHGDLRRQGGLGLSHGQADHQADQ